MSSPWLARPEASSHRVRRVVHESWERARSNALDPERSPTEFGGEIDDLDGYRLGHPLAAMMPVIRRLLIRDVEESGLLVAVGDEMGRLLWVEGDRAAKRAAEAMRFVEGADWSERRVGTSAPGTALAVDHGIQIHDSEHFNLFVHGWSCTAVPVHDPETRRILGVIDITGDARAVDPHTLPLVEATAAAVEAELMVLRLRALARPALRVASRTTVPRVESPARSASTSVSPPRAVPEQLPRAVPESPPTPVPAPVRQTTTGVPDARMRRPAPSAAGPPTTVRPATRRPVPMHVLGRETADLAGVLELSTRHSEIVTVLSWHREGLTAARLAAEVYGDEIGTASLRPEIVRLRRILRASGTGVDIESRPYRMTVPIELDAHQVISLLDRGAHRVALAAASRGALLSGSDAPGIRDIRELLRVRLREAVLSDAAVDVLLDYGATEDGVADAEVWRTALRLLPRRSPKRAGVVAHLETLGQ